MNIGADKRVPKDPQNSKTPKIMTPQNVTLRIFRGKDRRQDAYQSYDIPYCDAMTILSALEYIRAHIDSSVLFQRSCWHGSCGTCSLMANGTPVLACVTPLAPDTHTTLSALNTLPLLADISVDRSHLYSKLPSRATYVSGAKNNNHSNNQNNTAGHHALHKIPKDNSGQKLENCIECAICETGCPVGATFMGPAALSAYYREIVHRPDRRTEILKKVAGPGGAQSCQRHLVCTQVCPAKVYPSGNIIKLQKMLHAQKKGSEKPAQKIAKNRLKTP